MERRKRALRTLCVWLWTLVIMAGGIIISSGVAEAAHASEVPAGYKAIRTPQDLKNIANDPAGNYILMNDIDLSETKRGGSLDANNRGWEPLPEFSGNLDGNGYKISNLTIYDCKDGADLGLFERLKSANIERLGLTDVNISSGTHTAGNVGALAGAAVITGRRHPTYICETYVTGKITGKSSYAGGIVGNTERSCVYDCYVNIVMSGSSCAGGIFGRSTGAKDSYGNPISSTMENCYVAGTLKADEGGVIYVNGGYYYCGSGLYYLEGTAAFNQSAYSAIDGEELTASQMCYAGYFSGFDFTKTWVIDARSEYKYPQLRSNPQVPLTMYQLEYADLTLTGKSFSYNGLPIAPTVKVEMDGDTLIEDVDYTVSYENNTKVGTGSVTVKGIGEYSGLATAEFEITKGDISGASVSFSPTAFTYDGMEKTPSVTVKDGATLLVEGTDYTYTISDHVNAGSAVVRITGQDNYAGECVKTFEIKPKAIVSNMILTEGNTCVYDGTAKTPAVTVMDGTQALVEGTDYTVAYKDNTDAGTASFTVEGKGNYSGEVSKNFEITAKALTEDMVTPGNDSFTYDGTEKKLSVTVVDAEKRLKEGTDYTIDYGNAVNAGTAEAVVKGKGNYAGSITKTFEIAPKQLTKEMVTLEGVPCTYDGTEKTPSVTVKDGNISLKKDTDYTVTYDNHVQVGTATASVAGKGNYTGTVDVTFEIQEEPEEKSADGFLYRIMEDGTVQLTKYIGQDADVVLPETIEGKTVASIRVNERLDCVFGYDNTEVRTVTLPKSLRWIQCGDTVEDAEEDNPFYGCCNMTGIFVDPDNPYYTSEDGALFSKDKKTLLAFPAGKKGTYTVPDRVTKIGVCAFANVGLSEIILQNGITEIGEAAFAECKFLKKAVLPDSVISVGDSLFFYCSSLSSVVLPDGFTSVKAGMFDSCKGLETIVIPAGLQEIGKWAFEDCDALKDVYYKGNEADWNRIAIDEGNESLLNAGIHFGYEEEVAVSIENAEADLSEKLYYYDGTAKEPAVTVKLDGQTLVGGTDYTVTYADNIKEGTAKVTVTGQGKYTGSITVQFTILPAAGKREFVWNQDNWNFNNSTYDNSFSSGKYIDQISVGYLNVLKRNLTNTEYRYVFDNALQETWGGSCYGMSSLTLLAKEGIVPYSSYKSGAAALYELGYPNADREISSLVTYYQMLQYKDVIQQQFWNTLTRSNEENIRELLALLDENSTVLVCFQKNGWGGHAILAYGYEYGSWTKNGVTYQGRIRICDPNSAKKQNDECDIYFNTKSYNWAIPCYSGITSQSGAKFLGICSDISEINCGGYLSGTKEAQILNYIARINAAAISDSRSVSKVDETNGVYTARASAPGDIVEDYSYVLNGESDGLIGYTLRDAEASYRVSQDNAVELQLSMDYEECYLEGGSAAGKNVIFDKRGYVEVEGESADYNISMTFDEDYPTDWFTIGVEGSGADKVSLEKSEDGYVCIGDNLKNVKVSAGNREEKVSAYFSTDYNEVYIYETEDEKLGVSVDTDGNGTYETELMTQDFQREDADMIPTIGEKDPEKGTDQQGGNQQGGTDQQGGNQQGGTDQQGGNQQGGTDQQGGNQQGGTDQQGGNNNDISGAGIEKPDRATQQPAVTTEKPATAEDKTAEQATTEQVTTKQATTEQKVTAPAKVKITSIKNNKSKSFTAVWKRIKNAKGYEVQYALNKKFTKSKKSKTSQKLTLTVKKLKKGKTYYVRVRAYNTDSKGNKIYGKWSSVKKIKIKK